MSLVSMERMKEIMTVPSAAERMLEKPHKEISFSLNLRTAGREIACFDAFVVYHNVALGPAKGGVRFAPTVSLEETRLFAEIMTYKNALMGLPFGGGKSGIRFDPYQVDDFTRIAVIKEYVHMIREELSSGAYIPAPDMGSNPRDMAIIYGETHRAESVTGKPVSIGGLPGRMQATGRGVAYAAKLGLEKILLKSPQEITVTIQGFGNVGRWSAYFLKEMGVRITAIADIGGAVYRKQGLDIDKLFAYCPTSRDSVKGFPGGEEVSAEEFLAMECDIFIPAAQENVITVETAPKIRARMIVEGANAPSTKEGEASLLARGITVLPDFFANSGGVIASYVEWRDGKAGNQTSEQEVFEIIDKKIETSFLSGVKTKKEFKCESFREAFSVLALQELIEAMEERLWI